MNMPQSLALVCPGLQPPMVLCTINEEYTIVSDYPTFFWGPLAHAHAMPVYQALSPPPFEGPGYKAIPSPPSTRV